MMPHNVPSEIQEEIIKRVHPVKSLIRFRSVSKQWKSLIDSSEFITHHALNHRSDPHHLLVRYFADYEFKYVSIVDDDSFPQHKSCFDVSPTDKLVTLASIMLDCCHGLVCLYSYDRVSKKYMFFVWNPSIRKTIGIPPPDKIYTFGFGVCSKTGDPKIVGVTRSTTSSPWKADIFRLSSRAWRSVPLNLHHSPTDFSHNQVVVDGAIHWVAHYFTIYNNDDDDFVRQIISFDLTSEEFELVELPESLARSRSMYISKLKESVVVLDSCTGDVDVWMMLKNRVSTTSFTKIFTVRVPVLCRIIGFRKNRQPVMTMERFLVSFDELGVYESSSEHMSGLGIFGRVFMMTSYTESLLLLNYSDSIIE